MGNNSVVSLKEQMLERMHYLRFPGAFPMFCLILHKVLKKLWTTEHKKQLDLVEVISDSFYGATVLSLTRSISEINTSLNFLQTEGKKAFAQLKYQKRFYFKLFN